MLALVMILNAVLVLLMWLPTDVETGLTHKVRLQERIDDARMPTLGLGFVILGGILMLCSARFEPSLLSRQNLLFLMGRLASLAIGLLLMRWAGPGIVAVFGGEAECRVLRDDVPWKYIGFVSGGTFMVAGLMALMEGRVTRRGVIIGLVATLALIALYDLPFEDLLLPSNRDV